MRLTILLLLLATVPLRANEIYLFTGPTYNVSSELQGCNQLFLCSTSPAHITGSFTTSLGLSSLINLKSYTIPNQYISSFSFTDNNGVNVTSANASFYRFSISTDSQGNILPPYWDFVAVSGNLAGSGQGLSAADLGEDWSETATTYGQTAFEPLGNVWSTPSDPPAPVPTPEPSTFVLVVAAMLCFVVAGKRWKGFGTR